MGHFDWANVIRSATPADLPAITTLIRALADYEKLGHAVALEESRLAEHLFGPQPFAEVLVAEESGTLVGFALFFHNYSTFLAKPGIYLEDLFVVPEHRGQGYGKKLLQALAKLALQRGCARLEWSVLNWNEPAIRFYESLGATRMGEWSNYRVMGDALRGLAVGER